ncbi:MAG: bifunctional (p)ppGpp synthetase/guanosine-3',5'-bis(diphosphate) 3'-pyrophosphohydrolase, partial [Clostridia bacterium]|nr:bifunctional (p)ppGpp synthetase/guanosine-3',5'-bis(diphosphate) 3'-pyrophosphohydrolase [Clostridia bacterium]MBR2735079.1 bifunctional (p)ppGpp synthetase/guanosine-3',5'-bis(diphosphate) 3'-pyrophosphohydrolase [Clostridia bacterium]
MKEISNYYTYEELIDLMKKNGRTYDLNVVEKAYQLAKKAHKSQKRVSGTDYILHPTSVAYILADLGMDTQCIAAALLHDVIEDTDVTKEEIEKNFGEEIANLVDGVTKLKKISAATIEEQQAEDVSKMLLAMLHDIRVIMIKLADRIHNMRTMDCMPPKKRIEKSLQNMEVFAPIAHRLGIRKIKDELEDRSLQFLDPIGYKEALSALSLCTEDAEKFIDGIKKQLLNKIKPVIPGVYVEGRVKSINEIYKKMFVKGKTIEEIYDIYAVRVIVNSVDECYNVFGMVHDMFQPIPRRFKDYISMPKQNMYQSLHTTVLSDMGVPFEIQIRTWDMHRMAEYGIAAHWKYKLNAIEQHGKLAGTLSWIRKLLDSHRNSNDMEEVVGNIKSDLVPKELFVLTPRGKVINLPMGSTVIDFAYYIHSDLGNHLVGAKVNKKLVSITHKLRTGEIVEVITSKDPQKGPSRDWLNFVKTSEARSKIKQWFKKECREENIVKGKSEIDIELRKNGMILSQKSLEDLLKPIISKHQCRTFDDFYAAVGYGGIQPWKLMPRFKCEYNRRIKDPTWNAEFAVQNSTPERNLNKKKKKSDDGVIVDSIDGCSVRIAKCCSPLPGDSIIGFITKGYGITIHKLECPSIHSDRIDATQGRLVSAEWSNKIDQLFDVMLEIRTSGGQESANKLTQKIFEISNLKFRSLSHSVLENKNVLLK